MVLVEAIVEDHFTTPMEPPAKQRKLEPEDILDTHWTVGDTSQTAVVGNFLMINQCWRLFNTHDLLERGHYQYLISS